VGFLDWFRRRPPVVNPPAQRPTVAGLVGAINAARIAHGLNPLEENTRLSGLASTFADEEARAGVEAHGNHLRRVMNALPGRGAGECLAQGQPDAASVVQAWLNHPPHRVIVLGNWRLVGVGLAIGRDGTPFWVSDFVT
jgi:uncharacterized protein YkwD